MIRTPGAIPSITALHIPTASSRTSKSVINPIVRSAFPPEAAALEPGEVCPLANEAAEASKTTSPSPKQNFPKRSKRLKADVSKGEIAKLSQGISHDRQRVPNSLSSTSTSTTLSTLRHRERLHIAAVPPFEGRG